MSSDARFSAQSKRFNASPLPSYASNLNEARNQGIKKGFSSGLSIGFVWLVIFAVYALGFWYGSKLIRDEPENYSAGKLLIVSGSLLTLVLWEACSVL